MSGYMYLDIQEEKEPKLLGERVEPVPEQAPTMPAGRPADQPAAPSAPPVPPEKKAPSARAGVYLRLPNETGIERDRAQMVLSTAPGNTPVYIRFTDSGRMVRTPSDWWVSPTPALLDALRLALGADNVAYLP